MPCQVIGRRGHRLCLQTMLVVNEIGRSRLRNVNDIQRSTEMVVSTVLCSDDLGLLKRAVPA